MATQPQKKRKTSPLGRLTSFGLSDVWQTALLLPSGWDDLRWAITEFTPAAFQDDQPVLVRGTLYSAQARFDGTPRLVGYLVDAQQRRVGFTFFGDTRSIEAELKACADDVLLYGTYRAFNGGPFITSPEVVDPRWMGYLRPRYPGKKGVINPDTVRERVVPLLRDALPVAADWLVRTLGRSADELAGIAGMPGVALEKIIKAAHIPPTVEAGEAAQLAMERLAAIGVIARAKASCPAETRATWCTPADWRARAQRMPFDLTGDQAAAVDAIVGDMGSGQAMRRLVSGDVGTGKTAVFALAAGSCVDGGGRVAILLPTEPLAKQMAREICSWWPELAPHTSVVTADNLETNLDAYPLLIGTTALLARAIGRRHLVCVDEQQKFSAQQREAMVHTGGHLLEGTATCIPRSQALLRYGLMAVSQLRQGHANKNITTRCWSVEEKRDLFQGVRQTIAEGGQILVIYPRREAGIDVDGDGRPPVQSVASAYEQWERLFPGRVVLAHSGRSGDDNEQAIRTMTDGAADILVSTTVVEVGLNIPRLTRAVVVHPERFGLVTLHQIRGRLVRHGGRGNFDLYLPAPVKEPTMQRLQVLVDTSDGFEVAERDMELRGFGDLSAEATTQTGADETFLFGRGVRPELIDAVLRSAQ